MQLLKKKEDPTFLTDSTNRSLTIAKDTSLLDSKKMNQSILSILIDEKPIINKFKSRFAETENRLINRLSSLIYGEKDILNGLL